MWLEVVIDLVALLWPFGRGKSVEPNVVEPDATTTSGRPFEHGDR